MDKHMDKHITHCTCKAIGFTSNVLFSCAIDTYYSLLWNILVCSMDIFLQAVQYFGELLQ